MESCDREYVAYMLEIEKHYGSLRRCERIKVEKWSYVLSKTTKDIGWKRDRNRYAILLLDQVLNKRLQLPFINVPPENEIPHLPLHELVLLAFNIQ